jgi:hypothetical protein
MPASVSPIPRGCLWVFTVACHGVSVQPRPGKGVTQPRRVRVGVGFSATKRLLSSKPPVGDHAPREPSLGVSRQGRPRPRIGLLGMTDARSRPAPTLHEPVDGYRFGDAPNGPSALGFCQPRLGAGVAPFGSVAFFVKRRNGEPSRSQKRPQRSVKRKHNAHKALQTALGGGTRACHNPPITQEPTGSAIAGEVACKYPGSAARPRSSRCRSV